MLWICSRRWIYAYNYGILQLRFFKVNNEITETKCKWYFSLFWIDLLRITMYTLTQYFTLRFESTNYYIEILIETLFINIQVIQHLFRKTIFF